MTHPWSGQYTMTVSGQPTDAVWFHTNDDHRPNFFLEASAFRPQLCRHFEIGEKYPVYIDFRESYHDYPIVERVLYGNGASRSVYLYPRHKKESVFY